jgi:predicted amidohydrolase
MYQSFKLALLQMRTEPGDRNRNLAHAEELISTAAAKGAKCILLPEAMNLGWTHPSARTAAEPIPEGESFRRLSACAKSRKVHICAGLVEKSGEKVYNSAVMIDPGGNLILLHRKLNELDIGHEFYSQGDRLNVAHTELGTIGVMICSDGFAKDRVLARSLCYMGADVILSPCAWAVPADHEGGMKPYGQIWFDSYIPVAREFSVWIAGLSNVGWITDGPWKGMKCIGNSLVIDPNGNIALEGPFGGDAEAILYVHIAPVNRPARGCGWMDFWKKTKT